MLSGSGEVGEAITTSEAAAPSPAGNPGAGGAPLANVLAVVVTYHPDAGLSANLAALRAQVETVLVIDNGSPTFSSIERTAQAAGCRVIGNGANLGVAAALNQAADIARGEGFDWLATFDQDSLAPEGAIKGLLDLYQTHDSRDRIAIVAMSHRDRAIGRDYPSIVDVIEETPNWRSLRATITSGSLVRCDLFDRVGLFDARLFIDCVDHDFCLRCRRAGLLVIEDRRWVLEHSIGAISVHNFLGRKVACLNHSPARRYYITRNTLEVCVRYLFSDVVWVGYGAFHLVVETVAVLVFEDDKPAKAWATLQGALHFFIRRLGPR